MNNFMFSYWTYSRPFFSKKVKVLILRSPRFRPKSGLVPYTALIAQNRKSIVLNGSFRLKLSIFVKSYPKPNLPAIMCPLVLELQMKVLSLPFSDILVLFYFSDRPYSKFLAVFFALVGFLKITWFESLSSLNDSILFSLVRILNASGWRNLSW